MKKLLPANKARVATKTRMSRQKTIGLAMFSLLVILIANDQIRLAFMNW